MAVTINNTLSLFVFSEQVDDYLHVIYLKRDRCCELSDPTLLNSMFTNQQTHIK